MYYTLLNKSIIDKNNILNDILLQYMKDALKDCYNTCAFSTFPYITYNMNSFKAINTLNSGDCVALCLKLKIYLNNLNIKSYIIPATIPPHYYKKGYLDISHVGLAVPNKDMIYILDPAFYFIDPIPIYIKNINKISFAKSVDIYNNIEDIIICEPNILKDDIHYNKYQQILKNTVYCECNKINNKSKWRYYITEVINPDESISTFFINCKRNPFIVKTIFNKYLMKDFVLKQINDNTVEYDNHNVKQIININNLRHNHISQIEQFLKFPIKKKYGMFNNSSNKQNYYFSIS